MLTTNFKYQVLIRKRLFYTQGDYGLWQCSKPCHNKTYDNEEQVRNMVKQQSNMKIPTELVPYCPICGAPMNMNLRCDDSFVQDEGWYKAEQRYEDFIRRSKNMNVVFLELGVGGNTPVIIKYPFWRMTEENENSTYCCINLSEIYIPRQIKEQSICIESDIGDVLK